MARINLGTAAVNKHYHEWRSRHIDALGKLESRIHALAKVSRLMELSTNASGQRPLAAVFDIDEVLLCNLRDAPRPGHQDRVLLTFPPPNWAALDALPPDIDAAWLHAARGMCPDEGSWPGDAAWADYTADQTGLNPAMPGAQSLLAECMRCGLDIFLVTGREEYLRRDTCFNLAITGLLSGTGLTWDRLQPAGGRLHMWTPERGAVAEFKSAAQAAIAKHHRIAVNVGDQLSDLAHGDELVLIPHSFYHTA